MAVLPICAGMRLSGSISLFDRIALGVQLLDVIAPSIWGFGRGVVTGQCAHRIDLECLFFGAPIADAVLETFEVLHQGCVAPL